MFRKLRKFKQAASPEECRTVLKDAKRAVLSLIGDDGYPYGLPVNFYYDEGDETIYIHGAKKGYKMDAMARNPKVCLTTWNEGHLEDGDWAWHLTSVIVSGRAEFIEDMSVVTDKARKLGMKYYPSAAEVEEEIEADINRVRIVGIRIENMTGKHVHEK